MGRKVKTSAIVNIQENSFFFFLKNNNSHSSSGSWPLSGLGKFYYDWHYEYTPFSI